MISKILGWDLCDAKSLIEFILRNGSKPLSHNFLVWSKKNNRQVFSVRNYYYKLIKLLHNDENILLALNLTDEQQKTLFSTKHFSSLDERMLVEKVLEMSSFMPVRKACLKISGGDKSLMLRYQNKFRQMIKHKKEVVEEIVYKLKERGENVKNPYEEKIVMMPNRHSSISKQDINSLFLGLLKLVQEESKEEAFSQFEKQKKELVQKIKKQSIEERKKDDLIQVLQKENEGLKKDFDKFVGDLGKFCEEQSDNKMKKLKCFFEKLKQQNSEIGTIKE